MNEQRVPSAGEHHPKKKQHKRKLLVIIFAVVLISAGIFLSFLVLRNSSTTAHIDSGKYQAVFFTNGQVYFGKLSPLSGGYLKLEDIYYLQTKTDDASSNPQETATETANDVELIKLGNEIHGPEDEMIVNKDQVLFFENLKQDSRVSQSIKTYQSQQKN
ncbi:MAG: hypothetical protein ACO1N2_03470 [Candidatus Saccharimonadota bacterium]|jgi:hypothetical protein